MELLDDFLPPETFRKFQENIMGQMFPWFFNQYTLSPGGNYFNEDKDSFQFTHMMYKQNHGVVSPEAYNIVVPILRRLGADNLLIRIKANLNPRQHEHQMLGNFHVDTPFAQSKTAIFYCNTNNGWTEFETGEKVSSVENRMVIFDANQMHVGYTCTDAKSRVVLNINYLPSK
tara:strand:+ start:122 stop:640 length:519 start_codon:yes stop_codon:yes gene_type:complete